MKAIVTKNLTKVIDGRTIFDHVDIAFPHQGLIAIEGESGCGKSTLLDVIAGIDTSYEGDVYAEGHCWKKSKEEERSSFRLLTFGIIRQSYDLLELDSVLANVMLPLEGMGVSKRLAKRKAKEMLHYVGLEDKARQTADTLSGGEKQRVALARALVGDPPIVLADEPTGALDPKNAIRIMDILSSYAKKHLVILVSHDHALCEEYAMKIWRLDEGKLQIIKENDTKEEVESFLTFVPSKSPKVSFPLSAWIAHAFHALQEKKARTTLSLSILGFALLSLGTSFYVKRDLEGQLNDAFSSLSGVEGIVMENAIPNEATFGRVIAASEGTIQSLEERNPTLIRDHGLIYSGAFEQFFADQNELNYDAFGQKKVLPGFGVRSFNEYRWLEDTTNPIYPERPEVMEEDQVILGLPYATMTQLALNLQVKRDYSSLGVALKEAPLSLFLELANEEYGYADTQFLSAIGVVEDVVPTLYHTSHTWNETLFEDHMGFPTADEPNPSMPWLLQKTYYVLPKDDKETFFAKAAETGLLDDFVFERNSYDYDHSHESKNKATESLRLYVYQADKRALSYADIAAIRERYSFSSYAVLGESSYYSFPASLTHGFASPFFLSDDKTALESVTDACSRLPAALPFPEVERPPNVLMGHYRKRRQDGLTFSSDIPSLQQGEKPARMNEICVSSSLFEKLNHANVLYAGGLIASETQGDELLQTYRTGKLIVTGVVPESCDVIYGLPRWCIDYWRDSFGMSSFLLEPKKVIFYGDKQKRNQVIKELEKHYPAYRFTDPSSLAEESIASVLLYVNTALEWAAILALGTAGFLLLVTTILFAFEHKKQGKMLYELGVSRAAITDFYGASLLLLTLLSVGGAAGSLILVELMVHQAIQSNFGAVGAGFSLDYFPFLLLILAAVLSLIVALFFVWRWVERRNFSREGKTNG